MMMSCGKCGKIIGVKFGHFVIHILPRFIPTGIHRYFALSGDI